MDITRMEKKDAALLNPLQLAYMGDAIWETMIRSKLILQRMNVHHMHKECVRQVNAGSQALRMKRLRPFLTEEEKGIVQRGRNAHAKHPSPRHQAPADYAESTGFEALIGYLFLTGNLDRLEEIHALTEETTDGENVNA